MADDPNRESGYRVRVFVDFWNFTLFMKDVDEGFLVDWSMLGPVLAGAAAGVINSVAAGEYQGLNCYGSYTKTDQGRKLHGWASTTLAAFPGVRVSFVRRHRKRFPPTCPTCYARVDVCPSCDADMRGTEEKGVDVRMATEMISLAWADNYDIAVLVSSDRDFVPVADFLGNKGIKVIHGAFPPKGAELTSSCWGKIDIPRLRDGFRR